MLTTLEMLTRITVAIVLGGVIGVERGKKEATAGLRTYALVTTGAAIAMLIGIYTAYGTNSDPTRIGAQVISGIGFLGAGSIMRYGINIKGLTTAASLWVMACIGLAVGAGMYEVSIYSTFLIFSILLFLPHLEAFFAWKKVFFHISLKLNDNTKDMSVITELINDNELEMKSIDINMDRRGHKVLLLSLVAKDEATKVEFIERLNIIGSVESIK